MSGEVILMWCAASYAAGVLSMAVWHGVHVFLSNRPKKEYVSVIQQHREFRATLNSPKSTVHGKVDIVVHHDFYDEDWIPTDEDC